MSISRKVRRTRVIKVSKTARAIKTALAMSAVMLSLAGTGQAWAGTCASLGTPTTNCTDVTNGGPWNNDTISQGDFPVAADPNETVLGGVLGPTNVTNGGFGFDGVYADWDGDNNVVIGGFAVITVSGADGVSVLADTTYLGVAEADIDVGGIINVDSYTYGDNAIQAYGYTGVSIDIGGTGAAITSNVTNNYNVYSVTAFAQNGDVNINNNEASPFVYGIAAISYTGNATAVNAVADDGDVNITGNGDFFAVVTGDGAGTGANSTAIHAYGYDDVTINVGGPIYSSAYVGNATGIWAHTGGSFFGYANVTNGGTMSVLTNDGGVSNPTATGMDVYGYYDANATNNGAMYINTDSAPAFDPTATYAGIGITVSSSWNAATATNNGTMYVYGYSGDATGMIANGWIGTTNNTDEMHVASAWGDAIGTSATGQIVANAFNSGYLEVDGWYSATGMLTNSGSESNTTNNGTLNVYAGNGVAIGIDANSTNYVNVYGTGNIYVQGWNGATGIDADGGDDILVDLDGGHIGVSSANGAATGIDVNSTGGYATVSSNAELLVSGYTSATGIYAFGDDGVDIDQFAYVTVSANGNATGINAASNNNNVSVYTSSAADLTVTSNTGDAMGIHATSTGSSGAVNIDSDSYIHVVANGATGTGADATGIYASTWDGTSTVNASGDITAFSNNSSFGIVATIAGGGWGSIDIDNSGYLDVTGWYTAIGIDANGLDSGFVDVNNTGDMDINSNDFGAGISASSGGSSVSIDNTGVLHVDSNIGLVFGIQANTGYGGIDIDNYVGGDIYAYTVSGSA